MTVHSSPLDTWASIIPEFEKLNTLNAFHVQPCTTQGAEAFWTAIAKLPSLRKVSATSIAIPPRLDVQFPHLVELCMHLLWPIQTEQWAQSFVFIFTEMPSLEK